MTVTEKQWLERAEQDLAQVRKAEVHQRAEELKAQHEHDEQERQEAKAEAERRKRLEEQLQVQVGKLHASNVRLDKFVRDFLAEFVANDGHRQETLSLLSELGAEVDLNRQAGAQQTAIAHWVQVGMRDRFPRSLMREISPSLAGGSPVHELGALHDLAIKHGIALDVEQASKASPKNATRTQLVALKEFTLRGKRFAPGDLVAGADANIVEKLLRVGHVTEEPVPTRRTKT